MVVGEIVNSVPLKSSWGKKKSSRMVFVRGCVSLVRSKTGEPTAAFGRGAADRVLDKVQLPPFDPFF